MSTPRETRIACDKHGCPDLQALVDRAYRRRAQLLSLVRGRKP
jgi:hypothetical protein